MIIKMVNEFKLTFVHFARPNAQTRCRSVDAREFTAGQKNCGKSELVHRAAGPSQAVGRGPAFCKHRCNIDNFKNSFVRFFNSCLDRQKIWKESRTID